MVDGGGHAYAVQGVALLAEGVDRNYPQAFGLTALLVSPSSRRAWIEIVLVVVLL